MSDHLLAHTGHEFDLDSAEVIWKSNNLYECQLMETALISTFPNCNNTAGDISVSPAYTSAFIHVSGLRKPKRTNNMRQNPPLRFYKSASLVTPHINTTQSTTSSTSPQPTPSTPIPAPRVHNSSQTPPSPPLSPHTADAGTSSCSCCFSSAPSTPG